jgi:hypothetical protein
VVVAPVEEGHSRRAAGERAGGVEPTEAAADDDDVRTPVRGVHHVIFRAGLGGVNP